MIDTDKYQGHNMFKRILNSDGWQVYPTRNLREVDSQLLVDAPLILAAYDKQVRWINDILFRLERMDEASTSQRLRFLLTVQEELEMMIE